MDPTKERTECTDGIDPDMEIEEWFNLTDPEFFLLDSSSTAPVPASARMSFPELKDDREDEEVNEHEEIGRLLEVIGVVGDLSGDREDFRNKACCFSPSSV